MFGVGCKWNVSGWAGLFLADGVRKSNAWSTSRQDFGQGWGKFEGSRGTPHVRGGRILRVVAGHRMSGVGEF